jgi:putative ABC transport system ATP-binding protein
MNNAVLEANNISYSYVNKQQRVDAVEDFSYSFSTAKLYALIGKSGSGKSTILSILGGLVDPSAGEVLFRGELLRNMDKVKYRRENASFVFQNFNLFPMLNSLENVAYVLWIQGVDRAEARELSANALIAVGLDESYFKRQPQQLSGGEQQRVAIARSLVSGADIILADEPTGNLDAENSKLILDLLRDLASSRNICVILATHDQTVMDISDEIIQL